MSSDRDSKAGHDGKADAESKPKSFFSPQLKKLRKRVFMLWAGAVFLLFVYILALLSLYWGGLSHTESNLRSLVVWIVDFDGQVAPYNNVQPVVGPAIVKAGNMALMSGRPSLAWGALPPSQFNNDPMEVRRQVYRQKAWAAIIVNANATSLLQAAVNTGNSSYDPTGAAQVVYVQSRDENAYSQYITPMINELTQQVTAQFGEMWARETLQRASNATVLQNIQRAPQALSPAIGFSTFNLRPFQPPVATPAVSVGLIYLLILAFVYFNFAMPIHMKVMGAGVKPVHFMLWRLLSSIAAYFFISLSYSLISLAFQIPFSNQPADPTVVANNANHFGKATFVVYWMLNWCGMMALGLVNENMATLLGQPWASLWLLFWVITNVTISFYNIDLAPAFYRWGWAWPFRNLVDGSRTLIFDTHSRLGLNFGVLCAWIAISIALFPLCILAQKKIKETSEKKEKRKQEKNKEDDGEEGDS